MGKAQDAIMVTAKIYQCRDSAKTLAKVTGDNYFEMIKDYKDIIHAVMKGKNIEPIKALLFISESKTFNESSGTTQMLFFAALCEIMEPSEENESTNK